MNNIDLETLEAYLDGKLASEEKILLENSLKEDASLREELELLKLSREAIAMNSWAELISGTQKSFLKERKKADSKATPLWSWARRIAAGLSFLLVVATVVLFVTTSQNSMVENFYSYQIPVMRGDQNTFSQIQDAYLNQDYELLESLRSQVSQSDLESQFILAMADIENKKPASAEIILKDLETRNSQLEESVFSEEIDYYLIQSLLQQEKFDEAELRLEKILQDPSHRYFKNFTKSDLWKIRILKLKKGL